METELPSVPILSGFQALVALCIWVAAALLYALFRSVMDPDPDPVRPSGPSGDR